MSSSSSPIADEPADGGAQPSAGAAGRWLRRVSFVTIALSLVWLIRLLPIGRMIDAFSSRVDQMGSAGVVVFGVAYVVAALLFIPGAAMTLAAGAIFGLFLGTAIVSVASTIGAALGFLIGRHFARDAVVRYAAKSPRFAAIDRAIGKGGWRVVGLLRLSPALPYSIGNYLYGLTSVRFVPYVLASWIAMLPGTFLYVYLGHAGRAGLEAAGGEGGRTAGEWALLVIGLLATVAVTVYVTRLARNAIRDAELDDEGHLPAAQPTPEQATPDHRDAEAPAPQPGVLATVMPAGIALVVLGAALYANHLGPRLEYLFGPPPAKLEERFADATGKARFDHAAYDDLLRRHVDDAGFVDYDALQQDSAALDGYLATLAAAPIDALGRDERLALLINAYNAFTLRLILDYYPVASIKDLPGGKRWNDSRWVLGGETYSLNQLEHEQIRPNFREPRVHFALVCAAVGCPPLRSEAYDADRLEAQLQAQAVYAHTHDRWIQLDEDGAQVHLTRLYDWYGGDFEQVADSVVAYAANFSPDLQRVLDDGRHPEVAFLEYDWALNSKQNRP